MEPFNLKPASDLGLTHRERVLSLRRESGLVNTVTHAVWWGAMRAYLKLYHRLSIVGRDNLPVEPPYLLVANHTSHLDAMVLASQLDYRHRDRIFPLAAGDTFFQTPVHATFATSCINALPMWRDNMGRHALSELRKRLVDDRCVYIIFPEGTRSRAGEMADFRAGLGMLVAGTDVPVVPCHIAGAFDAMPADARLPRPRKLTMRIGAPLLFADQVNRRAGWSHVAQACQTVVRELG